MRFFTPQLFLELNSPDGDVVDVATQKWERAIELYRQHLQKIRSEIPSNVLGIADWSFHDWDLVAFSPTQEMAVIVLRQRAELVFLFYVLSRELRRVDYPGEWPLSKKRVHWLYDELDLSENGKKSLVHRILLSDGTTLEVPFSECRVLPVKFGHVMSHSDLARIA